MIEYRLKNERGELSAWLYSERSIAILKGYGWQVVETRGTPDHVPGKPHQEAEAPAPEPPASDEEKPATTPRRGAPGRRGRRAAK